MLVINMLYQAPHLIQHSTSLWEPKFPGRKKKKKMGFVYPLLKSYNNFFRKYMAFGKDSIPDY